MAMLESIREYLQALATKRQAKDIWKALSTSDENFVPARQAFLAADDHCDNILQQVVRDINEAQGTEGLEDVLEVLSESEMTALHAQFSERGLLKLLEADSNGLGSLVRKYRKSGAFFTAAQQINSLRRSLELSEFEACLPESPANIDGKAWMRAVVALQTEVSSLQSQYPEAEKSAVLIEAAFAIERRARAEYDRIGEQLISVMQDLIANGRFDSAVAELDPTLRKAARDLCSHVPQPQMQAQPKSESRALALEEPEVDAEGLADEIESWLRDQ